MDWKVQVMKSLGIPFSVSCFHFVAESRLISLSYDFVYVSVDPGGSINQTRSAPMRMHTQDVSERIVQEKTKISFVS